MIKQLVISLIRLYQAILSPDHSWLRHQHPYGYCRFSPTCSEYAVVAVEKRGVLVGTVLALWRVLRCNPLNRGGVDLVR